jgi:ribosomal protein S7
MLKPLILKKTQIKKAKVSLYNKVIGSITKKGKKNLAKKALNHSLYLTSKLYNISSSRILTKILNQISCYAEVRKVVRRKNVNLIPFPVSKARQRFLKIK